MKIACISTKDNYYNNCTITIGRYYYFSTRFNGLDQWNDVTKKCVYIIDDFGQNREYPKSCFLTQEDIREKKLNKILNDICN